MSKAEPWRLKELAMLLEELVLILNSGRNREWARVFAHFCHELTLLGSAGSVDQRELRRLIGCFQLCLASGSGFSRLVLEGPDSEESAVLNLRFSQLRSVLAKAVEEIGERLVEYVN
jgi:hypothetical protein